MINLLQQLTATLTTLTLALQSGLLGIPANTQLAQVSPSASITLSPATNSVIVDNTFTVNINLNTGGQNAYGADVNRLRFNPTILQVVDASAGTAGVQITAGTLMPLTIINTVDNSGGSIQFSQLANPGTTFSGSGTLAMVTFRAISAGSSNATFDFTLGNGTDTNVAGLGGDLLLSVNTGSYTVNPAPDTTAPSTPTNFSATTNSSSQINLSWSVATDNVGVTGYRLERCQGGSCSNFSQIATPSSIAYNDTALSANTTYRYRVRAVDAAGNLSSYSSIASATTQPPPDTTPPTISSVSVSAVTTSGATISWTTNEPANTQVEYGLTTAYGSLTTLNSTLVTNHSISLSSLSPATSYNYRVRSRDAAGNLALSSNNILTTGSLPDTTAPTIPTGLTATSTSETQVQLSWNASTDPAGAGQAISGVANYRIFRDGVLLATTDTRAYLDTNLTPGVTYSYQVAAADNAGNISNRSASVSATTPLLSLSVQRRLILNLEGAPTNGRDVTGTVEFLNPLSLTTKVFQASITTSANGQYVVDVPAGLPPVVTVRPVIAGYLSKLLTNVDLRDSNVLNVNLPTLPAGDFVNDQLINSLDFSYLNDRWSSTERLPDLNRDGVVNSLDFAYLSNNWLLTGE